MLSFFRSSQSYAGLPFLVYGLLLQLPLLLQGKSGVRYEDGFGFLGEWLVQWVGRYPTVALLVPILLMGIMGVQASYLVNRHNFVRAPTQLGAIGLLLVWGLTPGFRALHPGMLANFFLLAAAIAVAGVYKNPYPEIRLFNAGLWLGLATLFVPGYFVFAIPLFIASGLLGRTELASFLRLLTGFGVVYLLLGTLAYLYGGLNALVLTSLPQPTLQFQPATPLALTFIALLCALVVLLITQMGPIVRVINIEGNKGVNILYWLLLFSPFTVLLSYYITPTDAHALVPVAGILLGLWLNQLPERVAELGHLLLLVAALLLGALG